ncbi:hypothetical protein H634G_11439 [Metarhizium anisopliae BRIP 53293]|uniref:Uncharacterized protein n=1 Tax=Metarhizium anisopliae BRIP 53293 TaxID=1291518 RepID=A0A0D9NHG5_METAN|nr:hypothetical protein H634G_11439 [Metarhizium anisopliae BRIP 53293]
MQSVNSRGGHCDGESPSSPDALQPVDEAPFTLAPAVFTGSILFLLSGDENSTAVDESRKHENTAPTQRQIPIGHAVLEDALGMQRGVRGSTIWEEFKAYLNGLEEKARQRQKTRHEKGQQKRGPERERPEGAEGAEEAEEVDEAGRGGGCETAKGGG